MILLGQRGEEMKLKMTKNEIGWIIRSILRMAEEEKDLDRLYNQLGEYLVKEFDVEVKK